MSEINSLKTEAKQLFSMLAEQAGLTPEGYSCGAEWIKDDRNRLHIVQRYDKRDAPSLVVKYAKQPVNQKEFAAILGAHKAAQSALSGSETNIVPEIIAEASGRQAYLMRYVEGETFLHLCRTNSDHNPFLRKAGAWLAAFHGGSIQQRRPFQPRFMVGHMQKLARQMHLGERHINGQRPFIGYAETIGNHAVEAEGHIGTIAAKHGDLNAHNMLMSNNATAVFDFLGADHAPVAYDIARFLQSYTQMVGDLDKISKGNAVPDAAWAAFFEGYDLVAPDDPVVIFLSKVQVLTDWNRMQDKTTLKSILRLERVKEIARRAFA